MQLHETSIFPQCPAMQMSTGEWKVAAIVAKMAAERKSEILNNVGGDYRSVKIKSLEAAKIMKIKWLVLGCIEADFCK